MKKSVPFENTFLYATMEVGSAASSHESVVHLIDGQVSLVRFDVGGLSIYLDVATARSLATQIMRVTNDGDLLWETEPMTGEEVDQLTDALRTGVLSDDSDGDAA